MPQLQPLPMLDAIPLTLPKHPSRVIVSTSFGKDSIAALLLALEVFGSDLVAAHYQVVEEEWPGTLEYGQRVCDDLGVPLSTLRGTTTAIAAWTVAAATSARTRRKPCADRHKDAARATSSFCAWWRASMTSSSGANDGSPSR